MSAAAWSALWMSLQLAALALLIATPLAIGLAWWMARVSWRGKVLLELLDCTKAGGDHFRRETLIRPMLALTAALVVQGDILTRSRQIDRRTRRVAHGQFQAYRIHRCRVARGRAAVEPCQAISFDIYG